MAEPYPSVRVVPEGHRWVVYVQFAHQRLYVYGPYARLSDAEVVKARLARQYAKEARYA